MRWICALALGAAGACAACDMATESVRVAQNPRDPNAYVSRANCLASDPNDSNLVAASNDLETALKMDPNNFDARHNHGQVAYLLHRNDFAKSEFSRAIALNPQSARSYLGRGWTELKLCQFQDANADFDHAVSIDRSLLREIASAQDVAREQAGCSAPPRGPVNSLPVEFVCGRDNAMLWCQSRSLQARAVNRQAWIDSCIAQKVAQCS